MNHILPFLLSFVVVVSANAAIKTETLNYKSGASNMEGYLVYEDESKIAHPAILLLPGDMGLSDDERNQAQILAQKGYLVLVADLYGKGKNPSSRDDAKKSASPYYDNRKLLRERILTALKILNQSKAVDPKHIVIVGQELGGTGALELARTGIPAAGFASIDGELLTPEADSSKNYHGPLLLIQRSNTKLSKEQLKKVTTELNSSNIDYQFMTLSKASSNSKERVWNAVLSFLRETAPLK